MLDPAFDAYLAAKKAADAAKSKITDRITALRIEKKTTVARLNGEIEKLREGMRTRPKTERKPKPAAAPAPAPATTTAA